MMRKYRVSVAALAALWMVAMGTTRLGAFTPPVDTAGPLTVRIAGPAVVTETETPVPIQVLLENRGEAPLAITLELGLVDPWRAAPAAAARLTLAAHAKLSRPYTLTAGQRAYSALYPVHAWARFELDGKPCECHPILILEAKLPAPPHSASPPPWKVAEMPAAGELALRSLSAYRAVVQVFREAPKATTMPVGWQGNEPRTSANFSIGRITAGGDARESIVMHPPWRDGLAGTILAEFPLRLPRSTPLRLQFANAVQPEGHGDGVTFRVRVLPLEAAEGSLGQIVFDRHTAAKTWQPGEADLAAFAGRSVRLQLESHPGPAHNTGWDRSYWARPTLVAGTLAAPLPFPPADPNGSQLLGSIQDGGTRREIRLWPGRRGLLDATVGFMNGDQGLYFRGFEVQVLKAALDDPAAPFVLREVRSEACVGGCQVRHEFEGLGERFDLVGRLSVEQGVLRAKFSLENAPPPQPWHVVYLEDVAAGRWSSVARQVYAGQGNVLRQPQAFQLPFDGHRLATSFVGFDFAPGGSIVQACDVPPDRLEVDPGRGHYSLHVPHASTLSFIPAANVWEGVKVWRRINGLHAAGGVTTAAGRFVFDLWGGGYRETAQSLERAFRYGLTDSMVVFHNWQRWGYDYRLPDLCPPQPRLGTPEEMRALVQTCRRVGVPFAPHDNYIDFYPDAEGFSYDQRIAFRAPGQPVRAWFNRGREAQSYRYRADQIEPFLRRNLQLVRDGFAPTGYFIDVWSSAGPYDYWTADGRFFDRVFTRNTWGRHFAWIRDYLGGNAPTISESGHDQLIGWLDGGQTNHLRVDRPAPGERSWCVWNIRCADAERIPWSDAAHHDRFVLHGAGYPGRYEGGLSPALHGIYSDDYMATEVLTGHPAMVPAALDRDVVRKYWLLHGLGRGLAGRTIESVEFAGGDLHRQHVRWSGGGEVWVNRGAEDWTPEGVTLPQYGFLARVPGRDGPLETSIARRDGLIVETARSAGELYVNGRQLIDPRLAIRVEVLGLEPRGPGRYELALRWQLDDPLPAGFRPFFHFVDPQRDGDGIVFQASGATAKLSTAQHGAILDSVRFSLPGDCRPGQSWELRYGFYQPGNGARLALRGAEDGTHRIGLGTIRLEGSLGHLAAAWRERPPQGPDPLLARWNPQGKAVDFGCVITAGGCRLTRVENSLLVTPLPQKLGPPFAARLRWDRLPWGLAPPGHVEALDADGKVLWRAEARLQQGLILISGPAETFAYRLGP
jgi:hypothetical protein